MSEVRLIDADALMVSKDWASCTCPAQVIHKAPTIDAIPVVHGRWVSLTECSNAGVYCSICHKKVYKEDYAYCKRKNKLRSDFCPNCGARMDG